MYFFETEAFKYIIFLLRVMKKRVSRASISKIEIKGEKYDLYDFGDSMIVVSEGLGSQVLTAEYRGGSWKVADFRYFPRRNYDIVPKGKILDLL